MCGHYVAGASYSSSAVDRRVMDRWIQLRVMDTDVGVASSPRYADVTFAFPVTPSDIIIIIIIIITDLYSAFRSKDTEALRSTGGLSEFE